MTFKSLSAAAAVAAACFVTTCANPAFATGEAAAPAVAGQPGPGGPDGWHGPAWHGVGDGFGRPGPGAPGPDMPFGRMHGLTLSEAQQDKLFAIMHAQAPQRREYGKAIRKAHDGLRALARADRFDDAKAGALARDLGQAIAAEALLQARTEAQALALLTPEQRDQLRQRHMHDRGGDGRPEDQRERR